VLILSSLLTAISVDQVRSWLNPEVALQLQLSAAEIHAVLSTIRLMLGLNEKEKSELKLLAATVCAAPDDAPVAQQRKRFLQRLAFLFLAFCVVQCCRSVRQQRNVGGALCTECKSTRSIFFLLQRFARSAALLRALHALPSWDAVCRAAQFRRVVQEAEMIKIIEEIKRLGTQQQWRAFRAGKMPAKEVRVASDLAKQGTQAPPKRRQKVAGATKVKRAEQRDEEIRANRSVNVSVASISRVACRHSCRFFVFRAGNTHTHTHTHTHSR